MNNAYLRLASFFILVLGLAASNTAPAQEMVIDSANPASTEQGTANLPVDIIGTGFDETVDEVKFLLHCTKKNCPDSGDIIVNNFTVDTSTVIKANITVLPDATVADFDIAVTSSRGRGGKGTTYKGSNKFSVKIRPNQTIVSCMKAFFPVELEQNPDNTICDCNFTGDLNFMMQEDCTTSETLKLAGHGIWGGGEGSPFLTLTAVNSSVDNTFHGSSVISNTTDRDHNVRYLNIRFDPLVDRGCDAELKSAISFVLNDDTDDPFMNSFLAVTDVTIDTNDYDPEDPEVIVYSDPLCTAIELLRFTAVETDPIGNFDGPQVFVVDVTIAEGSYEKFGINHEGMQPGSSLNKHVVGNYIGAPDCFERDEAPAAIQFGRILLTDPFDPSSQDPGVVESNIIRMENSRCPGVPVGVGIRVVGEPWSQERTPEVFPQTTVKVVKNVISGALVGVEVDENVVHVNFSGNTLIGDDSDPDDIGICSEALTTDTKGKPNRWSGYDESEPDKNIVYVGCFPAVP